MTKLNPMRFVLDAGRITEVANFHRDLADIYHDSMTVKYEEGEINFGGFYESDRGRKVELRATFESILAKARKGRKFSVKDLESLPKATPLRERLLGFLDRVCAGVKESRKPKPSVLRGKIRKFQATHNGVFLGRYEEKKEAAQIRLAFISKVRSAEGGNYKFGDLDFLKLSALGAISAHAKLAAINLRAKEHLVCQVHRDREAYLKQIGAND